MAFSFGSTTNTNPFGGGGGGFGAQPAASPFGGGASSTFGAPAASNPFGAQNTGTSSLFGAAPAATSAFGGGGGFGATNPTPAFGGSTSFGGAAGAFGNPAASTSTFGGSTAASPFGGSTTTSAFGAPAAGASLGGGGLFGQTNNVFGGQPAAAASPFGATPATSAFGATNTSSSLFGNTANQGSSLFGGASGAGSAFGSAAPTSTGFGSAFGNSASSTFGAAAAPFGGAATTAAPFGSTATSNPTSAFGFGGGSAFGGMGGNLASQFIYKPVKDPSDASQTLVSITAQDQFKGVSFEEIRLAELAQPGTTTTTTTAAQPFGMTTTQPAASTGFGFGNTAATTPFGAAASPLTDNKQNTSFSFGGTQTGGGLFGNTATPAAASTFGGTSGGLFGNTSTTAPATGTGFNFGSTTSTTPAFGATPSSTAFGATSTGTTGFSGGLFGNTGPSAPLSGNDLNKAGNSLFGNSTFGSNPAPATSTSAFNFGAKPFSSPLAASTNTLNTGFGTNNTAGGGLGFGLSSGMNSSGGMNNSGGMGLSSGGLFSGLTSPASTNTQSTGGFNFNTPSTPATGTSFSLGTPSFNFGQNNNSATSTPNNNNNNNNNNTMNNSMTPMMSTVPTMGIQSPFGEVPMLPAQLLRASANNNNNNNTNNNENGSQVGDLSYKMTTRVVPKTPRPINRRLSNAQLFNNADQFQFKPETPVKFAPDKKAAPLVSALVPRKNLKDLNIEESDTTRGLLFSKNAEIDFLDPDNNLFNINNTDVERSRSGKDDHSEQLGTTLTDDSYYCEPSIRELERMTTEQLQHIENFTVGREGVGKIVWTEPVDVRLLGALEKIVVFTPGNLNLYSDGAPPCGEGLNKPAVVTLLGFKPKNKKTTPKKYEDQLRSQLANCGNTQFVSYNASTGEFSFSMDNV